MRNIWATSRLSQALGGVNAFGVAVGIGLLAQALWGVWATDRLLTLGKREVVTVQLSRLMSDFIAEEARSGRPPEETQLRVQAYLKAIEASTRQLGRDGRTVLVAEAVVAGQASDLTPAVRADVARRMGVLARAAR
ncbi:TrbI F-type domain-containing protein [Novosphingobium piscinae]|uniref:TrbI F-type domain-containing protein n=1 Tax=Novosphingobium piscinae TaxID=1507448 RepID=A0A7X1KP00_9SPHN|nr:TrbI F-type domain-containing protein [Novosphingobium piscinae]MBC2668234.1 TrbI F-type domain-containing protein [Novosphingobium piscinae]